MSMTKASGSEKIGKFGYACQMPRTKHLTGLCPHCGQELEFFTVAEIKNQRRCYHCKGSFDRDKFATDLGFSI